ncbi:glycoprotein integral membrane protein 1 isoform X2 [Clupea harengus]|uniref:Glycoprotein integral membrane protein 1 isoform X2 n=1 Tax=Clupea harengus TaxID=7950 RepID=A0A6P8GPN4_CLUHA|nr:glycoprotein integral membrane protein 1 isoform X2 [Clupea harengus]
MAPQVTSVVLVSFLLSLSSLTKGVLLQFNSANILLNLTTAAEHNESTQHSQISLNFTFVANQSYINDIPVASNVTRLPCQALLLDSSNSSTTNVSGLHTSCVMRVLVDQLHLRSDDGEDVLVLVLNEEVIELDGKGVQQQDVCEVKLIVNENVESATQFTNTYPMSKNKLFWMPREDDVVMTDPSIPKKEDQVVLHTTSHYPFKHAETTQEETAAPGKLPETPLRMDPDLLYDSEEKEAISDYLLPESPLRASMSSYNAMCEWVEQLRERLRRFWAESLPIFFLVMWVVVVGVVGSAVIVHVLDLIFPTCEHPGVFHLNPATLMPEDEKCTLLENIELVPEEEEEEEEGAQEKQQV